MLDRVDHRLVGRRHSCVGRGARKAVEQLDSRREHLEVDRHIEVLLDFVQDRREPPGEVVVLGNRRGQAVDHLADAELAAHEQVTSVPNRREQRRVLLELLEHCLQRQVRAEEDLGDVVVEIVADPLAFTHARHLRALLLISLGGPRQSRNVGQAHHGRALVVGIGLAGYAQDRQRPLPAPGEHDGNVQGIPADVAGRARALGCRAYRETAPCAARQELLCHRRGNLTRLDDDLRRPVYERHGHHPRPDAVTEVIQRGGEALQRLARGDRRRGVADHQRERLLALHVQPPAHVLDDGRDQRCDDLQGAHVAIAEAGPRIRSVHHPDRTVVQRQWQHHHLLHAEAADEVAVVPHVLNGFVGEPCAA